MTRLRDWRDESPSGEKRAGAHALPVSVSVPSVRVCVRVHACRGVSRRSPRTCPVPRFAGSGGARVCSRTPLLPPAGKVSPSQSAGAAALGDCRQPQGSGEFTAGPGERRGLFCTCTSAGIPAFSSADTGIPAFSSADRRFLAGRMRLSLLLTLVGHLLQGGQVC